MRAGVDECSHVSRGVCVVKFRTFIVVGGAIFASSFSAPTKFGPVTNADAADGIRQTAQEAVTVPEFVPILNFSQFVLATEQFAEANRLSDRTAAEALSAKFALASEVQHVDLHQVRQTPAIIESALSLAAPVSDPVERPAESLADPVKVITVVPEAAEVPAAEAEHQQTEATATESNPSTASRPRAEKRFRPAMGLGMAEPDDAAALFPPSAKPSKKKSANKAANRRLATAAAPPMVNSANAPDGAYNGDIEKQQFQIGIPGQSMEPLISTCAKGERKCFGPFCGC
ncbi:hypothetical protein SAMN04488557_0728 [Hyphomicrobium facile]|uniref:Uncharacterized protein n=1 Tax=Hyphomicrobium facile TaxID=51670 RepID=A0A1I7MY90_9HYPH|nr:hypothetical protein SAMN04488557_0728 [Hyphomicrobium facile]